MTLFIRWNGRPTGHFVGLLLAASACGSNECLVQPCPQPLAVEVTVVTAATGATVSSASFVVSGPVSGAGPCTGGVCRVSGEAGTYELDVSAPGYQTTHRQVVVAGTSPSCGCSTAETQHVTVSLVVAG